ncbi:hypothetical protein F0562_005137 [Nyssa sinensis]|uniref:Uncharacterized protein n=1 Tax=Nyssa sinensis TaxID=561372 RepID=A0A5J5AJQ2_9ASTE|nr:hypothetical protein F0562_005137 [Nyssa sinensis]
MSNSGSGAPRGISLSNTIHSEVAPCLPLPSLPVFCGAFDPELRLFDEPSSSRSLNRNDVLNQAGKIADLLGDTDVSYLNLRAEVNPLPYGFVETLNLHNEVLRCNSKAFEYIAPGPIKEQIFTSTVSETKPFEHNIHITSQAQRDFGGTRNYRHEHVLANETFTSRKPKIRKKGNDDLPSSTGPDPTEIQDATIGGFCEVLEDFCGRAEIPSDDRDEEEWLPLPVTDLRMLVNEIMSARAKKVLHLVPVDSFVRVLRVLDHQIHRAEGLSVNECDHSDSDVVPLVYGALESIHAALAVMAHNDMPKQLYKEEIIERILEFTRHQIMDIMLACDPVYRALHKPSENGGFEGEEYDDADADADFGSASKKRRTFRSGKVKKSVVNKVSAAVNNILQKLCTILRFSQGLVLLQLKSVGLISGIFHTYTQHRTYVMDEVLQLLLKLPFSKRIPRTYHLG